MLRVLCVALAAAVGQHAWPSHTRETAPSPPRVVATVNAVAVLSDRVEAAVNALLPLESFHQNVSAPKVAELRQRALKQVVDEELQYQDGVKRGVRVKDAEVAAALADAVSRYPSRKAFDDAVTRSGLTLADVRKELRRRLLVQRSAESQVSSRCSVGEAQAREFYARHPERFVEPERLHVHAITIAVEPSSPPEEWPSARKRTEDIRHQLLNGASFEEMAKRFSSDAAGATPGDMGLVHRGSLNPDFESVVATLEVGEVSTVVETIYGYHLITISEILPPRSREFTDVAARLQRELSEERCAAAKEEWLAALRATATIRYPQ